jgi:hypothetical protein
VAIVFISPKQRQKTFFLGITAASLLILIIVSLFVFFAKPKEVQPEFAFNRPKVSINVNALNSNEIKSLEPFPEIEIEFAYEALTIDRRRVAGSIWAISEKEAIKALEEMKLFVSKIEEVGIGRDNPFQMY